MSSKREWGDWKDYTVEKIKKLNTWLDRHDVVSLIYRPQTSGDRVDKSHHVIRTEYDYSIEVQCRKSNGSFTDHILLGTYNAVAKKNKSVRNGPVHFPKLQTLLPHPKAVLSEITRYLGRIVEERQEVFKVCDWKDESSYYEIKDGENWYSSLRVIKWQKKRYSVQVYEQQRVEDPVGCLDPKYYRFHIYYGVKLIQLPALSPLGKIIIQRAGLFPESIASKIFSYLEDGN